MDHTEENESTLNGHSSAALATAEPAENLNMETHETEIPEAPQSEAIEPEATLPEADVESPEPIATEAIIESQEPEIIDSEIPTPPIPNTSIPNTFPSAPNPSPSAKGLMKLDCPRKEFSDAVSMAQTATRAGSPQNIFQNLKIETKDGAIRVLGCDGEMWVERQLACMVHEAGATCVQAKLLSDIVTKLPDGPPVQLKMLDTNGMLLQQGASEYRMLTLDAEDFPEPPDYGGEGELTMKMGDLRDGIDSVIYAVSTDMHRQILTGVLFSYDGATLTLVATDTHRLAVRRMHQPGIGAAITAVVPERALKAIKSLPLGDDDSITIRFGVGRLGVDAGGSKVVSQLLTGAYPNWERVVPSEWTRKWTVEADQLLDRVNRALVVARDSANRVRFKGDGDQIVISARSEEKGEAKEELPMVPNNGDVEVAFNGTYVQDAVRGIKGPGIVIEMTEASRPAVFRPADDENYFCVIMPMALA